MKFVAGSCIYCERWNATQEHRGDLVCAEHEDENGLCFAMWEQRLPAMFDDMGNYGR